MALRYSVDVRNAGLDARVAAIGPAPVLKIYGEAAKLGGARSKPLVIIQLPAKWMAKAEDGVAAKIGEWTGIPKVKGQAKSFCLYNKGQNICHIEGSIPDNLKLEHPHLAPGVAVTVEEFTIKAGNG
jgi:hypothetical protein